MKDEEKKAIYCCANTYFNEKYSDEELASLYKVSTKKIQEWRTTEIWAAIVPEEEDCLNRDNSASRPIGVEIQSQTEIDIYTDKKNTNILKSLEVEVVGQQNLSTLKTVESSKSNKQSYDEELDKYQKRVNKFADNFLTILEGNINRLLLLNEKLGESEIGFMEELEIQKSLNMALKNLSGASKTVLELKDTALQISELIDILEKTQKND